MSAWARSFSLYIGHRSGKKSGKKKGEERTTPRVRVETAERVPRLCVDLRFKFVTREGRYKRCAVKITRGSPRKKKSSNKIADCVGIVIRGKSEKSPFHLRARRERDISSGERDRTRARGREGQNAKPCGRKLDAFHALAVVELNAKSAIHSTVRRSKAK